MNHHRAYGLTIRSDRRLPFLPAPSSERADVTVHHRIGGPARRAAGKDRRELTCTAAGWALEYENAAGGWMRYEYSTAGAVVAVTGSVDIEHIEAGLIGVVCAVLLSRTGRTLLHGAALSWDGQGIVILGDSGSGKSTLAGFLVTAGAGLLSEDLTVVDVAGGRPRLQAGHTRLSLLPDAVARLGQEGLGNGDGELRHGSNKVWIDVDRESGSSAQDHVPVAAIYLLVPPDPGATASEATRLSGQSSALALLRNVYGAAWIRSIDDRDLEFCASLAAQVPVFALRRREGLAHLGETADLIRTCAQSTTG